MAWKTTGYGILGVGKYVPERVLTNGELEKMVETSDEWITSRTGIKERRMMAEGENVSDMATEAGRRALRHAGMDAGDIDLLIVCTCTPDVLIPSTACIVQANLGLQERCPAFDLNAACTGFAYGMSTAGAFLRAGIYKTALVIGVDGLSRILDYNDRNTCVLFGDGAGAAIMGETGPERGLISEYLNADGTQSRHLVVYDSGTEIRTEEEKAQTGSCVQMNGNEVFKFAVRAMGQATLRALEKSCQGMTVEDIDLVIPHQANMRIIDAAAKRLGVPMEKIFVNIQKYGNTSAASVPLAMVEALEAGRLQTGDVMALVAFGGGLTYGANIWVW